MAAFTAPTRAAVDAAYAAAMANGAYDEGAPGLRPQFVPNYYAAYVRDPDGNKIHFICRAENRAHPRPLLEITDGALELCERIRDLHGTYQRILWRYGRGNIAVY
jgi:hypothetical protein